MLSAARYGGMEVLELLCDAGANKDQADENGFTPLHSASEVGHVEVVCFAMLALTRIRP